VFVSTAVASNTFATRTDQYCKPAIIEHRV
jgi:hypothetical protein